MSDKTYCGWCEAGSQRDALRVRVASLETAITREIASRGGDYGTVHELGGMRFLLCCDEDGINEWVEVQP